MGSLVFIGRSLENTPYADLFLSSTNKDDDAKNPASNPFNSDADGDIIMKDQLIISEPPVDDTNCIYDSKNALTEAANLFKSSCCYQLNLSDIDPLFTTFSSGCRVLTRLHSLQRAIACWSKYSSIDEDMLPVSLIFDDF